MYRGISSRLLSTVYHNKCIRCSKTFVRSLSIEHGPKLEKWDLMSAVSLERKPVVARKLNELEKKVIEIQQRIETEQSYKSDHEIALVADRIRAEQIKKGDKNVDLDLVPEKTAQDKEDAGRAELKSFKLQYGEIEEAAQDIKSTDRLLDRALLLLVKEKLGDDLMWVFPQGTRKEGETMRQTAERVLMEKCGDDLKVDFFGNAPVGFYKYKYPKQMRSASEDTPVGAKIFFFKATLKGGTVKSSESKGAITDYQWAARSDLSCLQPNYYNSVAMFLVDEEH